MFLLCCKQRRIFLYFTWQHEMIQYQRVFLSVQWRHQCNNNGNINAVSSHAMTESKDSRVLLLCLKLAFESKWMICSAGTYLDSSSDFQAGAKLLFFPLMHLSNISSLSFFYFCMAGVLEMHWRDVYWGKKWKDYPGRHLNSCLLLL